MRTSVRIIIGCAIALLALAVPTVALARSPLTSGGTAVQLGFGATYEAADGTVSTHRGLDLAAGAGDEVVAPLAGEVTFVGRVPGAGGATVLALTIRTPQGSVTLLPLEQATVGRGAVVGEGQSVATVAEGGDASSSDTHIHMGLRTGSLYLDPTALLVVPITTRPESEVQPEPIDEPVVSEGVAGEALSGVASGIVVAPGVTVGAADAESAQVGVGSAATVLSASGAPVVAGVGSGLADADSASIAGAVSPGVTLAGSGGPVVEGLKATGMLADARQTISTGAKVARAASSAARGGRLQSVVTRGVKVARRGARAATLMAIGVLCAVGALWPLWRAGGMEGLGKVPVSAIGDDVAAVASR